MTLKGPRPMRVFRFGEAPREIEPGADLSFLSGEGITLLFRNLFSPLPDGCRPGRGCLFSLWQCPVAAEASGRMRGGPG